MRARDTATSLVALLICVAGCEGAPSGSIYGDAEVGRIEPAADVWSPSQDAYTERTETPDVVADASRSDASGIMTDGAGFQSADAVADAADAQVIDVSEEPLDSAAPDVVADATDAAELTDASDSESPAEASPACPAEMVRIGGFCIDVYEASRSDATSSSGGASTLASCRPGVIPWFPVTLAQARDGCASMGKRLCRPDEWIDACQGPAASAYSYGSTYEPAVCNGIDTFCRCSATACSSLGVCPYPHCFNMASGAGGGPCGSDFHVMPTGSFPACTNGKGVFDVNGNVWEIVDTSDGLEHFRGGAYNCSDSETYHRCDYDATWNPSAKGFRCCKDPI